MLTIRNLRCGYDKTEIVHGVSFDLANGEFGCIMGANGCGKTTTIKTILNILKPFGGEVVLDGAEVF